MLNISSYKKKPEGINTDGFHQRNVQLGIEQKAHNQKHYLTFSELPVIFIETKDHKTPEEAPRNRMNHHLEKSYYTIIKFFKITLILSYNSVNIICIYNDLGDKGFF